MNGLFRSPEDYELFLYTLTEQFSSVRSSTVVFIRRGATLARVAGELYFEHNFRLVIRERILYHRLPITIERTLYITTPYSQAVQEQLTVQV